MPMKVVRSKSNTALDCMQVQVAAFMFSCSGTDVLPRMDEGSGKPCAVDQAS